MPNIGSSSSISSAVQSILDEELVGGGLRAVGSWSGSRLAVVTWAISRVQIWGRIYAIGTYLSVVC